ncbi:serine hydrolase domain-containing protein [Desulfosarcina widdelii]|nr:serine hydrolase domain-containing protein [Desulfosarcina widdelii]
MKYYLLLYFVTVFTLGLYGCAGQTTAQKHFISSDLPLPQTLQSALDGAREKETVIGASASVIVADQPIWTGVNGMSDPTTETFITPDMLFDIGSVGKNYLATLILQLCHEGRLKLDDSISKWLDHYPNIDGGITVRQLLNHTSGVFDFVKHPDSPWQMIYQSTKIWEQKTILNELVSAPYFPPGGGWHYSTTNYILLRMIAEKILQTDISNALKTRYFIPLNLTHTVCIDPLGSAPSKIIIANNWSSAGYVDLAPKPQPWTTTSPHLIYTTSADLARWIHFLFYEKQVLPAEYLGQMTSFHSPAPNDPPLSGYGLGLMYLDAELTEKAFGIGGVRMWGHGGNTFGFKSLVMYLPDLETTIAVLINDDRDQGLETIFIGLLRAVTGHLR